MIADRRARKDDKKPALTQPAPASRPRAPRERGAEAAGAATRPHQPSTAMAQPPHERSAIRAAYLARRMAGETQAAGGPAESDIAAGNAALRGAYVAHLAAHEPEALSGMHWPAQDVLHDVYVARTATPSAPGEAERAPSVGAKTGQATPARRKAKTAASIGGLREAMAPHRRMEGSKRQEPSPGEKR
ncbi:MAG: hypothetical protein ACOY3L_13550 [Pseudomonadota bacterium]